MASASVSWEAFVGLHPLVAESFAVTDKDAVEIALVLQEVVRDLERPHWRSADGRFAIFGYQGERGFNVILTDEAQRLLGFYEGLALWLTRKHRGQGLGARLVCEAARLRDGSAVGCEPSVGFSPAGWAAHRAGYRLYRETLAAAE